MVAVIPDGMVEIWQPQPWPLRHPRIAAPALDANFDGFGRASTDTKGVAPLHHGAARLRAWPEGGMQAPHINVLDLARGVLNRLATRLYFDDDPALPEDPC